MLEDTAPPVTSRPVQEFCKSWMPQVGDIIVTGTGIKWYAAATGGSVLTPGAALVNGTYYASQTLNGCESRTRLAVTVSIYDPGVPAGLANQEFCANTMPTLADVSVTGTGIKWYNLASGGTALPSNTALVNGTTYYASQSVDDCEGTARLAVTVTFVDPPQAAVSGGNKLISVDDMIPQLTATVTGTDVVADWYSSSTGGTVLANGTATLTYTPVFDPAVVGIYTYYVEARNTVTGCVSSVRTAVTLTVLPPRPREIGGPVLSGAKVECALEAIPPTQLPVMADSNDLVLEPDGDPEVSGTYDDCEGTVIYKYTYTDSEGLSTVWEFTWTIERTQAPVELVETEGSAAETEGTVACAALAVAPELPVVVDACGNVLDAPVPVITQATGDCQDVIEYQYTYTDCAGLEFVWIFTYTVNDEEAPVIALPVVDPSYENSTGMCYATLSFEAEATDNCDSQPVLSYFLVDGEMVMPVTFPHNFPTGTSTVKVVASDVCGNTAEKSFEVVIADVDAPVITLTGNQQVVLCAGDEYMDEGATALDNCDGDISSVIVVENLVNTSVAGEYLVTYMVSDAAGNQAVPVTRTVSVVSCGVTISGTFMYPDTELTSIADVEVSLVKDNVIMMTTVTAEDGTYQFTEVMAGEYMVVASFDQYAGGAVNALDAGLVNAWGTGPQYTIDMVRFMAGDVIADGYIDSGDAAEINSYHLAGGFGGPKSWQTPVDFWSFWIAGETIGVNQFAGGAYPVITVEDEDMEIDFFGQVTGDFNQSFLMSYLKSGSVMWHDGPTLGAAPGEEVILPVTVGSAMTVGAFSLVIDYPYQSVEVLEVYLGENLSSPIPWNIYQNKLRISWYSNNPIQPQKDQPLFSVKLKVKTEAAVGEVIRLTLVSDPLNELGDDKMEVIPDVDLYAAILAIHAVGIDVTNFAGKWDFLPYPNPAADYVNLSYTTPVYGKVTIEVFNSVGQRMSILQEANLNPGVYNVREDIGHWIPGVYILKLNLFDGSDHYTLTRRLVKR
jgi:hypothetical protein